MSDIRELKLGQFVQFLPTEENATLTAGIVTKISIRDRVVSVDYKLKDGTWIRGAELHVSELISDEDAATHDIE